MDEEEELENTLIGQQEEAPDVNTGDVIMGGLGLGGAAYATQTGRAAAPTLSGPLSPLAQQVAANDAARQAAARAAARAASTASQPLSNLPRIGTLNPATGPSGGTTLPSQPSLQEARQAAARSAGVNPLSSSRLSRFGGPFALIYGAADLGLEALTGRGLSERIGEGGGEAVANLLFPGAESRPAFTEAELQQSRDNLSTEAQLDPGFDFLDYNARAQYEKDLMAEGNQLFGEGTFVPLKSNIALQVPGIQNIRNPGAFDPANIDPDGAIMSAGTVERVTPNSLVVDKISDAVQELRDIVGVESLSMEEYQAKKAAQTPPSVAALEATPSVAPPVESLSEGAQGQDQLNPTPAPLPEGVQKGSPQANFLNTLMKSDGNLTEQQIAQFSQDAKDMATTFDPVTGFSRIPFLSREASRTSTPMPGQTLSQFLRYEDSPEQRTEQFVDEQGRLRFRPTQAALRLQAQGEVAQPPVGSNIIPAVAQPPVSSLSSFEQDSLERQQRIGGTGSFEGDSDARDARVRASDRQPGESQTERDTRIAQSRTTGGQTVGLSFDDARRRAEGQLAEQGVRNPSASQVNALARAIQAGEPERLAELETKRAFDAIKLRDEEAKKDFKPQIVEIGDQRLIQLAPEYYQPIRPKPKEDEIFDPRILEHNGFVYYEVKPNEFERQPSTGQTREDILAEIKRRNEVMGAPTAEGADASDIESFATEAEAKASGVKGEVLIGGRRAVIE